MRTLHVRLAGSSYRHPGNNEEEHGLERLHAGVNGDMMEETQEFAR
jgi:hypothetical protein